MNKLYIVLLLVSIPAYAEINQQKTTHSGTDSTEKFLDQIPRFYSVKYVYDGDTILLANGHIVRLLGINTPEVKSRYKKEQAGGKEARSWLINKLKNSYVRLQVDIEKMDRYGRNLAHVFTDDGEHVNLLLVKNGLAAVNIYSPNFRYIDLLFKAQQQAEKEKLGIWQYRQYKSKPVSKITKSNYKGWQRIVGKLKQIHQTEKNIYLKFTHKFAIKIKRTSSDLFPDFEKHLGKQIEARGRIHKNKKSYLMTVYHPTQLIIEK